MKKRLMVVGILLSFLLLPFGGTAFAYSNIVAFGDSLSDNGNFGVWTNGQVWVEYLAADLGISLDDMALGGAKTVGHIYSPTTYGLDWQVAQYTAGLSGAPLDTLFTVWIGGNDFLGGSMDFTTAAQNAGNSIEALINAGASDIMVMNLPNLGAIPLNNTDPVIGPIATYLSNQYNIQLWNEINALSGTYSSVNFFKVDTYSLLEGAIANPEAYGLTNVTTYPTDGNYDGYLFWDDVHPTTYAHEMIADLAGSALPAVPVPAAIWLFGSGLIGLVGIKRRFK
ncbi:MAG: SGNH/GDSL hydrolase family protein [Pseudomonadota bacterium]